MREGFVYNDDVHAKNLFRKLARSTQHRVITIVSEDYALPAGEVNMHTDYRIDVQAVRAAVAGVL